jgi:endogenous inhibitor of DNA gyrase (YacG/DUF329 family)
MIAYILQLKMPNLSSRFALNAAGCWLCADGLVKDLMMTPKNSESKIVNCPSCGGDSVYAPTNAFRPFCSQRCKNMDLGAWASESFRLPTDAPPDDLVYGDAKLQ